MSTNSASVHPNTDTDQPYQPYQPYHVSWGIELGAANPRDAARESLSILHDAYEGDPGGASVFMVRRLNDQIPDYGDHGDYAIRNNDLVDHHMVDLGSGEIISQLAPSVISRAADIVGQHVHCGWSMCNRRRLSNGTLPPLDACDNTDPSCRDKAEAIVTALAAKGLLSTR